MIELYDIKNTINKKDDEDEFEDDNGQIRRFKT
jgi:hypothetical protein